MNRTGASAVMIESARRIGSSGSSRPQEDELGTAAASYQEACDWVFWSVLLALRDRALQEGGDAVINIKSFYKKNEVVSDSKYECHAGGMLAGVALQGTVVKLAR